MIKLFLLSFFLTTASTVTFASATYEDPSSFRCPSGKIVAEWVHAGKKEVEYEGWLVKLSGFEKLGNVELVIEARGRSFTGFRCNYVYQSKVGRRRFDIDFAPADYYGMLAEGIVEFEKKLE